jgi:hypothetical protein
MTPAPRNSPIKHFEKISHGKCVCLACPACRCEIKSLAKDKRQLRSMLQRTIAWAEVAAARIPVHQDLNWSTINDARALLNPKKRKRRATDEIQNPQ